MVQFEILQLCLRKRLSTACLVCSPRVDSSRTQTGIPESRAVARESSIRIRVPPARTAICKIADSQSMTKIFHVEFPGYASTRRPETVYVLSGERRGVESFRKDAIFLDSRGQSYLRVPPEQVRFRMSSSQHSRYFWTSGQGRTDSALL